MSERLYTVAEAAIELGVDDSRVRQLARAGRGGRKVGRDWVFTAADLAAMRVRKPGRPATIRHP